MISTHVKEYDSNLLMDEFTRYDSKATPAPGVGDFLELMDVWVNLQTLPEFAAHYSVSYTLYQ